MPRTAKSKDSKADRQAQPANAGCIDGVEYLITEEAALYLRKSVSWLLREGTIAYLPGRPNIYARRDLDEWYDRNKYYPKV